MPTSMDAAKHVSKPCQTCHNLDRSKLVYWKGGPSRHRMFKRYFQHADFHSLKVPVVDLKWSASKSCPFCVVVFDVYRWLSRTKADGGYAAQNAAVEICVPFKIGYPIVLTYSWGSPVPRVYDYQISLPKSATVLPWSALTVGTQIPQDPRQSLFRASSWLRECLAHHGQDAGSCAFDSNRQSLPKRVLFIGEGVDKARLVPCTTATPYFALSYCWGPTNHLSTQKATLAQNARCVPPEFIPRTCRDAVFVTRALGYRYLWIDSLCIVQDDPEEWSQEASRMGDIYGNAILTVSATDASHVRFGCLNHRHATRTFMNRLRNDVDDPTHLLIREPNEHINLISSPRPEEDAPLHRRAWCCQERFLSTRILHFTAGELVWECSTSASCECGYMDNVSTPRLRFDKASLETMTTEERARAWDELALLSYQNRLLSEEKDRFPALSGLAQRFQTDGLGMYVAGLWTHYALSMMLWEVRSGKRAEEYVAPSFSWASVQGKLVRNDAIMHNRHFKATLEDLECTLASDDPYGAIKSASIIVKSAILDGVLSTGGHHSDTMILFNTHVRAFFVRDASEEGAMFGVKVKCTFLRGLEAGPAGRYVEALVLTETTFPDVFRRIGIAHLTKPSLQHLETLQMRDERIVIV